MNREDFFTKAAGSNLTATAREFVPRGGGYAASSSYHNRDNYTDGEGYYNRNSRDRYNNNRYRGNKSYNYSASSKPTSRYHDDRSAGYSQGGSSYSHYDNGYKNSYPDRSRNSKQYSRRTYEDYADDDYEDDRYEGQHSVYENRNYKTHGAEYEGQHSVYENRSYKSHGANEHSKKNTSHKVEDQKKTICQREHLIEQLNQGVLECLVCCERIKQREPVWSCGNCYHVLHFWCITKWAKSSKSDNKNWRCPACQNENVQIPEKYMCFCGKTKLVTEWNRRDTAHSCGEICGKSRENPTPWFVCEHRCNLLCHPGPCPSCTVLVVRECGCGKTQKRVQCSTKTPILCGAICDRLLNCGLHRCVKTCHFGECDTCDAKVETNCYCEKETKKLVCGSSTVEKFCCERICDKTLACGNHKCNSVCHPGECGLCPRSPIITDKCCCGKKAIEEGSRTSCLDPIPTCGKVCGKVLVCGPSNKLHTCGKTCHDGNCGPCPKKTSMKCRCGSKEITIACAQLESAKDQKCEKKCVKKRSCGKHKCNQVCCIDQEHICPQRCSGTLSCGRHRCELLCHRGKCGRCLQSSFEELYCHCGASVTYPPVPCGAKPPKCEKPCKREHDCEHPPLHTCHSDRTCPPCIVFTDKLCYGGHELRKTIPCYQKEFSCGLPCGRPLPCGLHSCPEKCHAGDCLSVSKKCVQPCTKTRDLCGHACGAPCHTGFCPDTLCRQPVKVTCACGNLMETHNCYDHTNDYRRIVSSTLNAKMAELQMDQSVDISDVSEKINAEKINLRTLECSDECKLIMRNRRLALALQIQNPDLNAKLTPRYSDFMKSWAKKDPILCRHVHDQLTALVKLAKESKQKSRSFSFQVMNKEKRQLVHEYCAHFGCESAAYDAEPKRNVVAIAVKGRCWLPAYSLMEVLQREMGQRKVPIPVFNKKLSKSDNENVPTTVILPVMPSANSSQGGFNYFGD